MKNVKKCIIATVFALLMMFSGAMFSITNDNVAYARPPEWSEFLPPPPPPPPPVCGCASPSGCIDDDSWVFSLVLNLFIPKPTPWP